MKLLIVEDDAKIARTLKQGLEQEHIIVDLAEDGEAGLDLASTEEYDVIVLDWMLPKKDGPTVSTHLRNEHITTPILMLTAKGQLDDKLDGFDAGADDYLVKPFAFEELLARIKALARRPKERSSAIFQVGDVILNVDTFQVTREGQEIGLSAKEFQLLSYLMQHAGTTVDKDHIIENVWPFESDILPNTVEQYIGYLRKKLEKPFPKKSRIIETVRGFGYKMIKT
ncbi:response regulator transcription factor [Candidatus Woesebacteria bacterium]|nr:response regulator transcription factor [Candidatus Woesebacteria bacterium]